MNVAGLIFRPWYWVSGRVFATWARPAIQPENPVDLLPGVDVEVCYVLETGGLADTLALERVCRIYGMPLPAGSLNFAGIRESRRIIVMRHMRGFIFRRKRITGSMRLKRIVEASVNAGGDLRRPDAGGARYPDQHRSWLARRYRPAGK